MLTALLVGIRLLFFIVYRIETERKFTELVLIKDLSTNEIAKMLSSNNLSVKNQNDGIIKFSTEISLFSWGETVTIIKVSKDLILINSQPSGKGTFTLFKERINYNKIKCLLEE